ncbi:MAG: hypothetical protein IT467_09080 [Dokdonella sp.]|uniref:pilus assembly protein n=1 Tax=Dokdonella sp. TaxID=2291710 RepID=UPI0025B91611|nr:PilC/PilY family type IV pilus protein [Dokdonella sp.]MBZ0223808.1 hypothetical protein [Dokdonella sp.]MCC7256065.1 hypothetical protein [Dokdonella sp.]
MTRIPPQFKISILAALVSVIAGLPQAVRAAPTPAPGTVNLLTTPPELSSKVAPNIVLTFDDSGSMNWHHMPDAKPFSGGGWNTGDDGNQGDSNNRTFPSGSWPYLCAGLIRPRAIDATLADGDPRLWAMNGVYYNADAVYQPPVKADGTPFPPAVFTAAWNNGIEVNRADSPDSSEGTTNLATKAFCGAKDSNGNYGAGYAYYNGPALVLDSLGRLTATSALYTNSNWKWHPLDDAEKQNFANWWSYYRTRKFAAMSATSLAFVDFDASIRVVWQNINKNFLAPGTSKIFPFEDSPTDATRSKFYKWLFANTFGNSTPNQAASDRAGKFFQVATGSSDTNPYWDRTLGRELSCRKNFNIQMTDGLWNQGTVAASPSDTTAVAPLPDGRAFSTSAPESKIIWNEDPTGAAQQKMADIAFKYWATDLRPDFKGSLQTKLKVRPYLVDRTTGVTGSVPLQPGDNWLDNKEIYWNPTNDPATWPHLVQFMIGFGVSGTIPKIDANYLRLRQGLLQWPKLDGSSPYTDNEKKIDDMWHAALNSRGMFFAASNPDELIQALRKIIASVVAQSSASTPASVSLPILTGGNSAYQGSYDSGAWSGSLRRSQLDAAGQPMSTVWDAGCMLSGGDCPDPVATGAAARDPSSRIIITSDGAGHGKAFRSSSFSGLTSAQQNALNQKPGAAPCPGGSSTDCDTNGPLRIDYLRGVRANEASTATPKFRQRTSVLGAIINAEPAYVSSPRSGYHDMFPPLSPEAVAAASDEQKSYAGYQNAQRNRRPMVYVGANDGMLHAFDAETGVEKWAYVPDVLIRNGRLAASTKSDATLVPAVDSKPRERDVFIKGSWRTILLGSLRLGGRGIYALDVTNASPSETDLLGSDGAPLWEFSNGDVASTAGDPPCATGATTCPSLGYTYDSVNVARLKADNKWVAVVSTGYFPSNQDAPAVVGDIAEPAASRTSLLVIDLETGKLIRELRTTSAPQTKPVGFKTFGLSTPMVYDEGSDEVDDLVYAGDLAGNLWRFNLSDADPANWGVDLMFTTYGNGGATTAGDQPIVFNPTALRDPVTRRAILVVGSGKYLGEDDRTSLIPKQAFYGIRDYGTASSQYPIKVNQLVTQTLAEASDETRSITGFTAPTGTLPSSTPPMRMETVGGGGKPAIVTIVANGWRMPLEITTEKGERAQRRAIPVPTANIAFLYGLIPKSDDPCDPGARYSIMAINAATGAAINTGGGIGTGQGLVGGVVASPAPPSDPVVKRGGAGAVLIGIPAGTPMAVVDAINKIMNASIPPWHRGSWRELLDW